MWQTTAEAMKNGCHVPAVKTIWTLPAASHEMSSAWPGAGARGSGEAPQVVGGIESGCSRCVHFTTKLLTSIPPLA